MQWLGGRNEDEACQGSKDKAKDMVQSVIK